MDSSFVGRDEELARLTKAITAGSGAVVTGPAGIGKTRVVREAARESGRAVSWMPVTAESASIPYGPFGFLVPELTTPEREGSPLTLIRQALEGGGRPSLLVVDDAQLLDHASAATVHALAFGGASIVATVRDGEQVPGAITALWKDAGLARLDLKPLSRPDAERLTTDLLGGAADSRTLAEIWKMTQGHPMELRELIFSAMDTKALVESGGVWTLTGSLDPTSRLIELVEERMRRLDEAERAVAETLAFGEPLDLRLLVAATDTEVVERMERSGMIHVLKGITSSQATLTHPLYGEVLRSTMPATQRAALATALASAVREDDAQAPDPLRVASWRLESGEATAEELEQAAIGAVQRMAWELTLKFATSSLALAPSYMAHGCSAAALAELGDPTQAEKHLRQARELVDDPAMLAWNTISIADVWFYHADRMEDALELVRKELAQTTDPAVRDEVSSALAINLMMHGNIEEVTELASEVLERPDASTTARFMALVATTSADGVALRPGAVRSGVEAALPLVQENRHRFANAEDVLHAATVVADVGAGDLSTARTTVDKRLALALEGDSGDLPGFWTMFNGVILLYEGLAQASHDAHLEAQLLLDRYDSWLSTPLARVGAAHAAAVMGSGAQARVHIDALSPAMRSAPRIRSRVAHVEALLTSVEEGITAGAKAALAAGDLAAGDSHLLWAGEAWHLAARLGRPDLVSQRLTTLASDRPGTIVMLLSSHAAALEAEDLEALDEVSSGFERAGFMLWAAEAAARLAGLRRRAKEERLARKASARARELLPADSGARTPPFSELVDLVSLTPREREVALLAAGGVSSKEIAERLFISVRSVDNHLSRVYSKLGVGGRSELADVLIPTV